MTVYHHLDPLHAHCGMSVPVISWCWGWTQARASRTKENELEISQVGSKSDIWIMWPCWLTRSRFKFDLSSNFNHHCTIPPPTMTCPSTTRTLMRTTALAPDWHGNNADKGARDAGASRAPASGMFFFHSFLYTLLLLFTTTMAIPIDKGFFYHKLMVFFTDHDNHLTTTTLTTTSTHGHVHPPRHESTYHKHLHASVVHPSASATTFTYSTRVRTTKMAITIISMHQTMTETVTSRAPGIFYFFLNIYILILLNSVKDLDASTPICTTTTTITKTTTMEAQDVWHVSASWAPR